MSFLWADHAQRGRMLDAERERKKKEGRGTTRDTILSQIILSTHIVDQSGILDGSASIFDKGKHQNASASEMATQKRNIRVPNIM